ncbi:GD12548 [Drosophila simulans]|uniref:GD12548 n=1 Tax=Drosophila simulans TaxID=7240 RepID=B4QL49_DROSI|nr:GD12548 [Drosophila simulans]
MRLKTVLTVFFVISLTLVAGQERDCDELARKCESCVRRLNNSIDRDLPLFNKECRQRTQLSWRWRNVGRCELSKLNCLATGISKNLQVCNIPCDSLKHRA